MAACILVWVVCIASVSIGDFVLVFGFGSWFVAVVIVFVVVLWVFGAFDVGWLCWILLRVCWLFECGEYCWVCLGVGFDCGIVGGMTNTGLVLVWFSVW